MLPVVLPPLLAGSLASLVLAQPSVVASDVVELDVSDGIARARSVAGSAALYARQALVGILNAMQHSMCSRQHF